MGRWDGEDYLAFVRARRDALEGAAFLICGDHHLAQDLVQEALVKLGSRWERVSQGSPDAYVRRILYRDMVSRWRRLRRENLVDIADPAGPLASLSIPSATEAWVDGAQVRQLLQRLPPRQRAVIVLRYFEDLTEKDTAAALGVSVGTVKSHAHAALQTLRSWIPELAPDPGEAP